MHEYMRIELQTGNELRYARRHIDKMIRDAIMSDEELIVKVNDGVIMLDEYVNTEYSYTLQDGTVKLFDSKNKRVEQLRNMDLHQLVMDIFVGIAYVVHPQLFTSVTAQMAGRLNMSDKYEAIQTVAEIMAVLCNTDVFDINKASQGSSLMIVSRMDLPEALYEFIEHSEFLPPMVCMPKVATSNYESGYLTFNDSLILGSGNHHDGDICLDVINLVNSVPLTLDTEFLSTVEETPKDITVENIQAAALKKGKILSDAQAKERVARALENWDSFKQMSYHFYHLMVQQGNRFHILNKVDKRGRLYSQGYHINSQGSAFKKSMIELADQEIVEGVPPEYQL